MRVNRRCFIMTRSIFTSQRKNVSKKEQTNKLPERFSPFNLNFLHSNAYKLADKPTKNIETPEVLHRNNINNPGNRSFRILIARN